MNVRQTLPGFSEKTGDSQRVFRAVLGALSRPGLLTRAEGVPPSPYSVERGGGFGRGMTALALALCDNDTVVWLDDACDGEEVRHHLRFHCASPVAEQHTVADFAFVGDALSMPRLETFRQGLPAYPDRSATVVIKADLHSGQGESFTLLGPGVRPPSESAPAAQCRIGGLPKWFRNAWSENHMRYPLGVDVLLVDDALLHAGENTFLLMGLPRSVVFVDGVPARAVFEEKVACMSQ